MLMSPNSYQKIQEPTFDKWFNKKIAIFNNSKIIFPNIPAFVVKAIFGEMSELVLSSQKVRSNKLKDYNFKFSNIDDAIKDLSNKIWHSGINLMWQ